MPVLYLRALVSIGAPAIAGLVTAQVQFSDVTGSCGFEPYTNAMGMAAGVALADYDGDGNVDIFVPTAVGLPDQLYRNLGGGLFDEIAADVGLASIQNNRAGLWLDYDADDDLDLLVVGDSYLQPEVMVASTMLLYRQDPDGCFTDVTVEAGLYGILYEPLDVPKNHVGGLCAGDVSGDDRLDLLVMFWEGHGYLLINDGNGGFTDETAASGMDTSFETFWQPVMYDFNGDGRLDIFSAVDFNTNDLWINQGDTTFVNVAADHGMENDGQNDMGSALGDFDNDGDLDLYVSNIHTGPVRGHLYRNDRVGANLAFTELAEAAGVADGGWGWGTYFADLDRDTLLDLAVTNGFVPTHVDATRLFRQQGEGPSTFLDIAGQVGFGDMDMGSCLIAVDYDRDGDLDSLQTCVNGLLRMLENTPQGEAANHGYLVVEPRMNGLNHFAIGTLVQVEVGAVKMGRLITAGTSLMGQEPAEAFFGLGSGPATVDLVRIVWPDRRVTRLEHVAVNQVLTVTDDTALPACVADVDLDGAVGIGDVLSLLAAWGPCMSCPQDTNGDGLVGILDFLAVLAGWGDCP